MRDRLIVVQIIVIKTPLLRICVTIDDMKHCGRMPNAREDLNRSLREENLNIKSLEGMRSRSHSN